jgi:hypothetical protein
MIMIVRTGFSILSASSIFSEILILIGLISIIYGSIGRELFKARYRLIMDNESIKMKKSYEKEIIINLNTITHLKTLAPSLEITYNDYIKTIDFSWLTPEEFERFKLQLGDYCLKRNLKLE